MREYNPDAAAVLLNRLRTFFAENEHWYPSDVSQATGIPKETLYVWTIGRNFPKPRSLANMQALEKFLDKRESGK